MSTKPIGGDTPEDWAEAIINADDVSDGRDWLGALLGTYQVTDDTMCHSGGPMNAFVCPVLYALCVRVEAATTTTERDGALSEVIDHVCYCEHDHPYCAAIEPHEPNRTASASDQRADLLDWAAEITEFALQP